MTFYIICFQSYRLFYKFMTVKYPFEHYCWHKVCQYFAGEQMKIFREKDVPLVEFRVSRSTQRNDAHGNKSLANPCTSLKICFRLEIKEVATIFIFHIKYFFASLAMFTSRPYSQTISHGCDVLEYTSDSMLATIHTYIKIVAEKNLYLKIF